MKKLLIIIPTIALIWACNDASDKKSSAPKKEKKEKVAEADLPNGKKIFKINCVLCHGADGKLGINQSKDLTKSTISLEEAITQITNGKGLMAAYEPILSSEEIEAVAKYTLTLREE